MGNFIQSALDWSEVWALLIPVSILLVKRGRPGILKPVVWYVWLALLINLVIDLVADYKEYLPGWLQSNNPLYNIHSLVRFICFSLFFILLPQQAFNKVKKWLAILSVLFIIINFSFVDNFFNYNSFSGNLLTVEAYLLLAYCMLYYLSVLRDDRKVIFDGPDFWVATGLSIYVVINFFVFLFYLPMITVSPRLAENIWNVHNIAFIIFCIFLTKALYGPFRNQYSS